MIIDQNYLNTIYCFCNVVIIPMNDNLWDIIRVILQNPSKETLALKESVIVSIINDIIQKIKCCEKYTETELLFNQLFMIQDTLAELLFVHHIPMISSLRKFIRDCERLDDPWLRKHLFQKIQDNMYSLT